MSKSPSLKQKIQSLSEVTDITPEDNEKFIKSQSELWLHSNGFAGGIAAIGLTILVAAPFSIKNQINEREQLQASFKPATIPSDVVLPTPYSPLYKEISSAIKAQTPLPITIKKEFKFANGEFTAKPANINLPAEIKPIDVKQYNVDVQESIDMKTNPVDWAFGGLSSVILLGVACSMFSDRAKARKEVNSLHDKYIDTNKVPPLPAPENT